LNGSIKAGWIVIGISTKHLLNRRQSIGSHTRIFDHLIVNYMLLCFTVVKIDYLLYVKKCIILCANVQNFSFLGALLKVVNVRFYG